MTVREFAAAWGGLCLGVLLMLILAAMASVWERHHPKQYPGPDPILDGPFGDVTTVPPDALPHDWQGRVG